METKKISISLHENESYIRKRCENCDDILIRPMRLGEGHKADCLMVYIEVAVSNMMLDDSAIGKMINHFWEIPEEKIREFIRRNSLGIADVKEMSSMEEVFGAILSGNAVFFLDGYDKAMKISSKGYPGLAVSEVKTEKVLRGSKEGFCDSVKTNAALVRKRIRDTRLKVEQSSIGVRSNTVVQLLYVEDLVHEELLTAVKERLESFAVDGILDSGMLEQLTEEAWYSPFPQFQTTERPDRAAQELLRGGTYMDSYVVGYEYINLRYGWVLSNYGTFPLEQMKNQEEIRTFIDNQASQTATLYWVNRTGAAPRQTSSLWLNVSGQCLVARITSAKNGLVGMLLIHLDMEYLSELAGEWKSLGYDVVLLDANGETVTTTDTELAHALADAGDLSDGHLRIPGTISNYLVQGQAINFNGITCYAAYDEQQNLGSSVAAFWVSVLILLATVVVLLVCRWNSAFLYRPIRELLDQA